MGDEHQILVVVRHLDRSNSRLQVFNLTLKPGLICLALSYELVDVFLRVDLDRHGSPPIR